MGQKLATLVRPIGNVGTEGTEENDGLPRLSCLLSSLVGLFVPKIGRPLKWNITDLKGDVLTPLNERERGLA
ncbi:MAG: hypothetical protein EBT08_08470 [Betaproteobacteria bacterium]|nr:hypothetical protein [Betaproteobacteria bacterium]